jgi:hypothetical protein
MNRQNRMYDLHTQRSSAETGYVDGIKGADKLWCLLREGGRFCKNWY